MPTIQRPTTDLQRLQALEAAKAKADVTAPADLAFSAATLALLTSFLTTYRNTLLALGTSLTAQNDATVLADEAKDKLRMFISHFFQVFNLGIVRNVYTKGQRASFMLDVNQNDLPRLRTEQEIATWGQRIVSGDAARVAAGGAAMSNPTAAQVQTEHTAYLAAQGDQSTKKDAYDAAQEAVAALGPQADELIADVWDQVEFTYRKEPISSKRRKAREYGVVYEPRAGETLNPEDFSVTGKITDIATGTALEDVVVRVVQTNTIVVTNSKGLYYVPVQPPAIYTIQVVKNGYETKEIPGVEVTADAVATLNIQMVPVTPASTGNISGTVTNNGSPYQAQLTVTVGGSTYTTHTQPDGTFLLEGVPAGDRIVTCTPDSDPANVKINNIIVVAGTTVTLNFEYP